MPCLAPFLSSGLLTASLAAASFEDIHPAGYPANNSYLAGVSADGKVAVGFLDADYGDALRVAGGTATRLGRLPGGSFSTARATSSDGSVIVGQSDDLLSAATAFRWTHAGMVNLGSLDGPDGLSDALAISPDGSMVVGWSYVGALSRLIAFKHVNGVMSVLHSDLTSEAYGDSQATGIASTGAVTGYARELFTGRETSFLVSGSTFTPILNPDGEMIQARGISADGTAVIGFMTDRSGNGRAFRWTAGGGTAVSLGTLGGVSSEANAVSADGKVVVGRSQNLAGDEEAFCFKIDDAHPDGLMTGLGFLSGGSGSVATGVSADGNVIVGHSTVAGGDTHAFLYAKAVMLDVQDWLGSVSGVHSILSTTLEVTRLHCEGAHHRPLAELRRGRSYWVTGDVASSSRSRDLITRSGEAGATFEAAPDVLVGVGGGYGRQDQQLANGGSASTHGQYLVGEVDFIRPDGGIFSVLVSAGDWRANMDRGYVTGGGLDYSHGETDLQSYGARLRYDTPVLTKALGADIKAYASGSWSKAQSDAYAETTGSFPGSFGELEQTAREGRLGVAVTRNFTEKLRGRLSAEWIRRFDSEQAVLTATDITSTLDLSLPGTPVLRDQARFGFDLDYLMDAKTTLSFTVHAAGRGESPDVSGAVSLRRAF